MILGGNGFKKFSQFSPGEELEEGIDELRNVVLEAKEYELLELDMTAFKSEVW